MTKSDFIKQTEGCISSQKIKEYNIRLNKEYIKYGVTKSFYSQFNKGSGHEIETGKFWAKKSSSRLAFDLYSWRAASEEYIDFEFEKKLPGVWCKINRAAGVPNMDVYFETKKRNNIYRK